MTTIGYHNKNNWKQGEIISTNTGSEENVTVNEKIDEVGCFDCNLKQSWFFIHEYGAELKYTIKFSTHSSLDVNNRRRIKLFRAARNDTNAEDIPLCNECSHYLMTIKD